MAGPAFQLYPIDEVALGIYVRLLVAQSAQGAELTAPRLAALLDQSYDGADGFISRVLARQAAAAPGGTIPKP
jgi:hypothetical protein